MSRCAVAEYDVLFCNKKKRIIAFVECDNCMSSGYADVNTCRNRNIIVLPKDDIENE